MRNWIGLAASVFGTVALMHWLSPLVPTWCAALLGILTGFFIAVIVKGYTEYPHYFKHLPYALAVFAVGIAALVHWLTPWFSTWPSASLLGLLVSSIISPLAVVVFSVGLNPRKLENKISGSLTVVRNRISQGKNCEKDMKAINKAIREVNRLHRGAVTESNTQITFSDEIFDIYVKVEGTSEKIFQMQKDLVTELDRNGYSR